MTAVSKEWSLYCWDIAFFTWCISTNSGAPRWAGHFNGNPKGFLLATRNKWSLSDSMQRCTMRAYLRAVEKWTTFTLVPHIKAFQCYRYEVAADDVMLSAFYATNNVHNRRAAFDKISLSRSNMLTDSILIWENRAEQEMFELVLAFFCRHHKICL